MGLTSSRPQPIFTQRSMGWGFLQERIVSKRYEGEIFKATMFLVLCNRLVSIASRLAKAWSKQESEQRQIPATGGCTIGVGIFSCLDRFDMIWLRPRWCLSIPNLNRFPEKSAEHFWISNFPPASSCCKSSPNSSRSFFWPPCQNCRARFMRWSWSWWRVRVGECRRSSGNIWWCPSPTCAVAVEGANRTKDGEKQGPAGRLCGGW